VGQLVTGEERNLPIGGRFQPKNQPARMRQRAFPNDPHGHQLVDRAEGNPHPGIAVDFLQLLQRSQPGFLLVLAQYFQTHERRMQYQEFREQGYPIGSGAVESGIKRFKHRLSGPGRRWSRPAAERMVVIRAAIMTDNFDDRWSLTLD
jgi:hypothetical protein